MAVFNVKTDLCQKIGNDIYRFLLSTVGDQVTVTGPDGTTISLEKALESIKEKIEALEGVASGAAQNYVKANIAERDAIDNKIVGSLCWVLDATADPTVDKGAAAYIWNGTKWDKAAEVESLDLTWDDIKGKPGDGGVPIVPDPDNPGQTIPDPDWPVDEDGNPLTMEDAIKMAHKHENKENVLDKFAVTEQGNLTFNGQAIGGENGGTFSVTVTGDAPDYEAAITALGDIPNNSIISVFRDTPTAANMAATTRQAKSFSLRNARS